MIKDYYYGKLDVVIQMESRTCARGTIFIRAGLLRLDFVCKTTANDVPVARLLHSKIGLSMPLSGKGEG